MHIYRLTIAMMGRTQGLEILADRREEGPDGVVRYLDEEGRLVAEVPAVIIERETQE